MPQTKERKAIYNKEYSQTPAGIKARKKGNWKYQGIIIKNAIKGVPVPINEKTSSGTGFFLIW